MIKKQNKHVCQYCKEVIDENYQGARFKKYVALITYENKKVIEEVWFHLVCYFEWFNSKAMDKANNLFVNGIKSSIDILKNKGVFR